jgi:hypothetical protein
VDAWRAALTSAHTQNKPFTRRIRGGEIPNIGSIDSDAGPFEGATVECRLFRGAIYRIHLKRFPAKQGERAMPTLFWLPMIFASVLWEINGFPPQALGDNDQAPA